MKSRKVSLVIGADGMIGQALVHRLTEKGDVVYGTTRRPRTISDKRIFLDLQKNVHDWQFLAQAAVVYFCASAGDLAYCRENPEISAVVNVQSAVSLAKSFTANGSFFIYLSTNLVFDGTKPYRHEFDAVCPKTEYGRQKVEAENQLSALGNAISIVRLTKVMNPAKGLIHDWIRALQNNQVIHPFQDMVCSPLPLSFVIEVLLRVGEQRLPGIIQVSGSKDVSYARIAFHIAQRLKVCQELVQPVKTVDAGRLSGTTPEHTALNTSRLRRNLGMEPPEPWVTVDLIHG